MNDEATAEVWDEHAPPRRRRWGAGTIGLVILALIVLALGSAWVGRRPIAAQVLERELAKRDVRATYRITRIGLNRQRIEDLVIGDPRRPDLTARSAEVYGRLRWGGFDVQRIVARGVHLRGRLVGGKLRLGEIDKLLPPPTGKPFAFPTFEVDVRSMTFALATPAGPIGMSLAGQGRVADGFRGEAAIAAPGLALAGCRTEGLQGRFTVAVDDRSPRFRGPATASRVRCRDLDARAIRLVGDVRVPERFNRWRGRAELDVQEASLDDVAGRRLRADVRFAGAPAATGGTGEVALAQLRVGPHRAAGVGFEGDWRVSPRTGRIALLGDVSAARADPSPRLLAPVVDGLGQARGTPVEPVARAVAAALARADDAVRLDGQLRLLSTRRGGGVRLSGLRARSASGATARVTGGEGLTYYFPDGVARIDGNLDLAGGGLPRVALQLDQDRPGGPISGVARIAPVGAGDARLALAPVRFAGVGAGRVRVDTVATVTGPFGGGFVTGLNLPVAARFGGGAFSVNPACVPARWDALRFQTLRLGRTALTLCPAGPAMLRSGGQGGLSIPRPRLVGTLGSTPIALEAAQARFVLPTQAFDARALSVRLGRPQFLNRLDLASLDGRITPAGVGGRFAGGTGSIGTVPLLLSQAGGTWNVRGGRLGVNGGVTVADRDPNPRFYPLRSEALALTLANNRIAATGTLLDPESKRRVTDVRIAHDLATGEGNAVLDVPGLAFDEGFQPEALTRLTQGVVALVNGTVRGQGRIAWGRAGTRSEGEFSTDDLDLAAAFGPVQGLSGTIRFSDLLGLTTAPGQVLNVKEIAAGITVAGGTVRYQLLPGNRVQVEQGRWPYAGGELILEPTLIDLTNRNAPKRLTFRVVGLDAARFVEQFEFENIQATGILDGVIPMVFDASGGRIENGYLVARAGGGTLAYVGIVSQQQLGTYGKLAFDALKNFRYDTMRVELNGALDGEFLSRFEITGRNQGTGIASGIVRRFTNLPFKFTINIRGQFRELLATARSFNDPRLLLRRALPVPVEEVPGATIQPSERPDSP